MFWLTRAGLTPRLVWIVHELLLRLEPQSTIQVKVGGKTAEVCCGECATKLREAMAADKKTA
jgi:hypothetical protein